MYNASGELIDYGYGKGSRNESEIGAMFESAEHWFSRFSNSQNENVQYQSSHAYIRSTSLTINLPLSVISDTPAGNIALRSYVQIGGSTKVLYPVALSTPKYVDDILTDSQKHPLDSFDYSKIDRYCTNSGVAIGSNELEATIHGLLEAIERHSLSKFLVRVFLAMDSSALRVIDKKTLPGALRQKVQCVEKEVGHSILIIELENEFKVPVFCSVLSGSRFLVEVAGYGCSLSREHALYRSLHEVAQCYHASAVFFREQFHDKANNIISKLSHSEAHLRCAKFKIKEQCQKLGFFDVSFLNTPDYNVPESLHSYLECLAKKIENTGCRAFSSILNTLWGGQVITHSFIETQDHFFCVTEGCFVFPNQI
ncbi:YcaO-like family protein [Pseudomonas sp. FYR_7]|uniref:YcaO-like family protein n=1 Tax=Pseudomonas sp. FYR_7 TaxID=3367174 RepID=UPI003709DA66